MAITDLARIEEILSSKEQRIQKVFNADFPHAYSLFDNHLRRQRNSEIFLDELSEVKIVLDSDYQILLLNSHEFEKTISSADVSNMEFDGTFCKLALVENYNCEPIWALNIAADRAI